MIGLSVTCIETSISDCLGLNWPGQINWFVLICGNGASGICIVNKPRPQPSPSPLTPPAPSPHPPVCADGYGGSASGTCSPCKAGYAGSGLDVTSPCWYCSAASKYASTAGSPRCLTCPANQVSNANHTACREYWNGAGETGGSEVWGMVGWDMGYVGSVGLGLPSSCCSAAAKRSRRCVPLCPTHPANQALTANHTAACCEWGHGLVGWRLVGWLGRLGWLGA